MRNLAVFQKLDVRFGPDEFPAAATIAFEYVSGEAAGPAQQITVLAGRRGTWTIVLTPHERVPQGAQVGLVKLENEFRFAYRHQHYWPDAGNYVTVEDGAGRALPFECDTCLKSAVWAVVTLPRDLEPGDPIVVRLGDRRQGGSGSSIWSTSYERARVAAGVRLPGDELYRRGTEATVSVRVVPCPPAKQMYVFAPSTVRPGERFTTVILPVDINGNPIDTGSEVEVTGPGGRWSEARSSGLGSQHVDTALGETGVARLQVLDRISGVTASSNPVRVSGGEHNIYWGEFHWHGFDAVELNVLNPDTHPDKAFRYGRDVSRLDFSCSGSHIFRHAPDAVHEWWELYRTAAQKYDQEGHYVTFLGCEWRDTEREGGDRNLVWRDLDAPAPDPTWKIEQMYALFRGHPVMVIPHVGGAIAMPYRHDPEVETLCEMTSGHGNFEWFAQAYLSRGYKVGFIGGSDGHRGTPGHPRVVSPWGGRFANLLRVRDAGWAGGPLLAVCAERLDRESLWRAFRQRRTYASTGARALVEFRIDGAPMGSDIQAKRDVHVEWRVEGTAPIACVDLVRDQSRRMRWPCRALSESGSLVDRPPDGVHYYYLRIEQQDGEMVWTSPIWVHSACGGAEEDLPRWNEPEAIDLDAVGGNPARAYLDDLMAYLRTEEQADAFGPIAPFGVVHSPLGDYAVFLTTVRGHPIRIHWFYAFEEPRIRLEAGWVTYGTERVMGQAWTGPLFVGQDTMG